MWYVHHLAEDAQRALAASPGFVLPLLSPASHLAACDAAGAETSSEVDSAAAALKRVCAVYKEQVTCASCHSNVLPPGHGFLAM